MARLFVNLGKSLMPDHDRPGILAEAEEQFGHHRQIYILAMENDALLKRVFYPHEAIIVRVTPNGEPWGCVDQDGQHMACPEVEADDVLVLNGGTTVLQACMLVHLSAGCTLGHVFNMQRDRATKMVCRRE